MSDRFSTQTDGYLMSSDGRRRKNLSGDNSIYGNEMDGAPADPVGGFGNIFRTAIAASGAIRIPGMMASSTLILVLLSHAALLRTWFGQSKMKWHSKFFSKWLAKDKKRRPRRFRRSKKDDFWKYKEVKILWLFI